MRYCKICGLELIELVHGDQVVAYECEECEE